MAVRDSQYNYAVLLARGMGVSQDFVASYVWSTSRRNRAIRIQPISVMMSARGSRRINWLAQRRWPMHFHPPQAVGLSQRRGAASDQHKPAAVLDGSAIELRSASKSIGAVV